MTNMTIAVEHISGDSSTNVPNMSRYRFFNLNNRSSRSGLKTTTAVTVGATSNNMTPIIAAMVTMRSKMFQPELKYSFQPSASIRIDASNKNTEKHIDFFYISATLLLLFSRDKNKYESHEAQKFLADCSRLSADSRTRISIARPFPTINASVRKGNHNVSPKFTPNTYKQCARNRATVRFSSSIYIWNEWGSRPGRTTAPEGLLVTNGASRHRIPKWTPPKTARRYRNDSVV